MDFITEDFWANDICLSVFPDLMRVDNKFLYYALKSQQAYIYGNTTKAIPDHIPTQFLNDLKIPVPPLPVQREIVRILDTFTAMNANLEEELTARRKQYDYALQKEIDFGEHDISKNVKWMPLGEAIVSLNTGLNPRQFFKLNTEDATNYYITIKEFKGGHITILPDTDMINDAAIKLCNHRSNLEAGDVLFSGTGTIGETVVIRETPTNWNIKEGIYAIKPQPRLLDSDFLRFLLMSDSIRNAILAKVAGGTVRSISMKDLKTILIPLPTMEIQKKIASRLSLFDELCCNQTEGLLSELALCRKQYEYYRDKLLAFKEA